MIKLRWWLTAMIVGALIWAGIISLIMSVLN